MAQKRVLQIGLDPALVDFSRAPGVDAEKIRTAGKASDEKLRELGYEVQTYMIDLGTTEETVVLKALSETEFDCIMIGAGLRVSIHSDSEESLRSDVGFRASYQWRIGSVHVEPFLKATWEHEFKYSSLPVTAGFADISGPSATFVGPAEGHDSAVVDAGLSVSWTPCISTYVSYNGL